MSNGDRILTRVFLDKNKKIEELESALNVAKERIDELEALVVKHKEDASNWYKVSQERLVNIEELKKPMTWERAKETLSPDG